MRFQSPSRALIARIKRLRRSKSTVSDNRELSDAYREVLRAFSARASAGQLLGSRWRQVAREAINYLGGQADRHVVSLADYDHRRYGPFLGVSDEGSSAVAVRAAAYAAPKGVALGRRARPLTVGVALDAEWLGAVGEVPVGPDEYADIWTACVGRTLMTTNVGSRANLRFYRRAPVVTIRAGSRQMVVAEAKTGLAAAFKPFLEAPGGPRPLVVFVQFAVGSKRQPREQLKILRQLLRFVKQGDIAAPRIHRLGLNALIGWDAKGRDGALRAIKVANSAGIDLVSIDGVVRKGADQMISLPGLLNYLPPELVSEVLAYAKKKKVRVRTINEVDPVTVAREIWSALDTPRAMGFDLGKYGLVPLTLEDCDSIVGYIQGWFPGWCAAPVFYIDQGIISRNRVYVGKDVAKGVEAWLRVVARHRVKVVLIDTVDKALGWKILKTDGDPKGILEARQVVRLNALGAKLGIKVLWAGGIGIEQAHEFGKLGVFGIYVTTAAAAAIKVGIGYGRDPALAAEKEPTYAGVLKVKTILEAGFLAARLASSRRGGNTREIHLCKIEAAGFDEAALSKVLPSAWRFWWRTVAQ